MGREWNKRLFITYEKPAFPFPQVTRRKEEREEDERKERKEERRRIERGRGNRGEGERCERKRGEKRDEDSEGIYCARFSSPAFCSCVW